MRYRKPLDLCAVAPAVEQVTESKDVEQFIVSEKRSIEDCVAAHDCRVRMASWGDVPAIQAFHRLCWGEHHPTLEVSDILFRMIRFGVVTLIETHEGRIAACNLNESYDDAPRTSYGVRISVDPAMAGRNFGAELARYSSLLCMARGSRLRRAYVGTTNFNSAVNLFNHVGFVADDFWHDIPIPSHRFSLVLPLTPGGITNNRIDLEKTRQFLQTHQPDTDYMLVTGTDIEMITALYTSTPFRVVACLKAGIVASAPTYLAVPKDRLGML